MSIVTETVDVSTPDGPMAAVVSRPDDNEPHPGIIVIQEIFGVNSNIQDIARRLAEEGYVAAAPDLFHRSGRLTTFAYTDFDGARAAVGALTDDGVVSDVSAVARYLGSQSTVAGGQIGITGYCYGGRVSFLSAARVPEIRAAAVYYGGGIVPNPSQPARGIPPIELAGQINGPIIGFFGGQDQMISAEAVDQIRDTLTGLGKQNDIYVYPDAGHGFFCDERDSYNKEASEDAWGKTLAFFDRHLKGAVSAR